MPIDFTDGARPLKSKDVIKFTKSNFEKIRLGKRTTIRMGNTNYLLGPVLLGLVIGNDSVFDISEGRRIQVCFDCLRAEIIEVRHTKFEKVTESDAKADGFDSVEELKAELENCYDCTINGETSVTIIKFKLRDDE